MPALPRLRTPALADLAAQLRFTAPDSARRQLARAEALAAELDPARDYPLAWFVHALTGFWPERAPAVEVVVAGAELCADLPGLIERLSLRAELTDADCPGWPGVDDLTARWGVSRRTIERYRRLGLVGRLVRAAPAPPGVAPAHSTGASLANAPASMSASARRRGPVASGPWRVLFDPAGIERFERAHARVLRGGTRGTRGAPVAPDESARWVRRALRYRRRLGWRLPRVAARLAQRFGRAPQTIRQALLRHDATAPEPIFDPPRPRAARADALAERADRFAEGASVSRLARRLERSEPAVRRAILRARARALIEAWADEPPAWGLPASASSTPAPAPRAPAAARERATPARPEPDALAPLLVRAGLGRPLPQTLADLLAQARQTGPVLRPDEERARVAAMVALRLRAARALALVRDQGPIVHAEALDDAVTTLRWLALVRDELARSHLRLLLTTLAGHARAHGPEGQRAGDAAPHAGVSIEPDEAAGVVSTLAPALAARALAASLDALRAATDRFDPARGGRVAGAAALAMSRAASRVLGARPAAARPDHHAPAHAHTHTHALDPARLAWPPPAWPSAWSPLVAVDARAWHAVGDGLIGPEESTLLRERFGWLAGPPSTIAQIARARGLSSPRASRLVREALAAALNAARARARAHARAYDRAP